MTHHEQTAHRRERQLLNVLILVLFFALAWAADHYGKQAGAFLPHRLDVAIEGKGHQHGPLH
jgi:hypothetical protein